MVKKEHSFLFMPQSILDGLDKEMHFKHGSDKVPCPIQPLHKLSILFEPEPDLLLLPWPTRPLALGHPDLICYSPPLDLTTKALATLDSLLFFKLYNYPPTLALRRGCSLILECPSLTYLHGKLLYNVFV